MHSVIILVIHPSPYFKVMLANLALKKQKQGYFKNMMTFMNIFHRIT